MAIALRQRQTPAEEALCQALRGGKLDGLKFRQNHAVANMAVDFYCPKRHLVIEVDGGIHDEPAQMVRDAEKYAFLQSLGNRLLRLRNEQILEDLAATLDVIRIAATNRPLAPLSPLAGGKGSGDRGPVV